MSHQFFNANDSPDSPNNELCFPKETDNTSINSDVNVSKNSNVNH